MSAKSKAEIYRQIAASARARASSPAGTSDAASTPEAATPSPTPEAATPSRAARLAELTAALAEREEDLETAKRKAMAYVEELLLDKQEMNRVINEEVEVRSVREVEVREAAAAQAEGLEQSLAAEEEARAAAEKQAREALAHAQRLRETVESLKRDGLEGSAGGVRAARDELEAARAEAARQAARLSALRAELTARDAARDDAKAAAAAAQAAAATAAAEVGAARDAAAAGAAALSEREAALAAAERALLALAPDEMAEATRGSADSARSVESASSGDTPRATDMTDIVLTPHTRKPSGEETADGAADERPLAEVLAEWTIDGAKTDSAITNPVLGLEALLSYVNEWRDALADQPKLRAPPAATANGAQ